MSMIGNQPGVSSQRTVLEEVVTGSPKSAFVPQSGYIKGYVDVLVNGTELDTSDFTAADGITINLAVAAAVGDTVKVKAWLPRGLSDGYLKTEADAKFAALVNGDIIVPANPGGARVIGAASGSNTTIVLQSGGASGSGPNIELTKEGTIFNDAATHKFRSLDGSTEYATFNGNGLVLPAGKGIDFSANSNAGGMTSEVLSDYEEGSWTPDWRIGSNAAGTWVVKTGRYTKVGNMVTVWAYLYSSTGRGAGTGAVTINNLPFNSVNSSLTNYHIMDARGGVSWSGGGAGLPYFYHPASTSYLIAYYTSNGTGAVTVQMTEANFSASSAIEINIMMTYETN